jgi:baculoviral IAP repeat-containing protein 6
MEEKWNSFCSLLQVLISIQSLIFVKEAYFNEPGFEKFQDTEKGREYSNRYNLHISQATLQFAIQEQLNHPSPFFKVIV